LRLNPAVAGDFTYNDLEDSCVQVATGDTPNTVTGGTILAGGIVKTGVNVGMVAQALDTILHPGVAIDNTVDEMVLCVMPFSSNANVYGSLAWREVS